MVWVFGNSYERVAIKDLGDIIYYRQKKQFSDQEFEGSRDLQREIQKGRIIKLEHVPEIKGSFPDNLGNQESNNQTPILDLREMRRVITEVIGESKTESVDIKDLVTSLIPVLSVVIRDEVSKIPAGQVVTGQTKKIETKFEDPNYIPEVRTDGMKSNINIEGTLIEDSSMVTSLELLKKMNI